jgi:acyl-[acyl carrier protein]--UDP-N-acetylglucosamine O-acyltransferase
MIATGGDLITTSGSYKIHTFTTVGTSSFVVSSAGISPTVECLLVGGGGGAG